MRVVSKSGSTYRLIDFFIFFLIYNNQVTKKIMRRKKLYEEEKGVLMVETRGSISETQY
jgi:hypothetical protein